MRAGVVCLEALLAEVARYARAAGEVLGTLRDGRTSPRAALLSLSGLGQQYLSSLAALPARFPAGRAEPGRRRRRPLRRQGRPVD